MLPADRLGRQSRHWVSVDRVLAVLGVVLTGIAVWLVIRDGDPLPEDAAQSWTLAAYFLAIVIGQVFPVDLGADREIAPIAAAASFGFAMTYDPKSHESLYSAALVISFTATAMLTGLLVRAMSGRTVRISGAAVRLIGVAAVALIFAGADVFGDQTLLQRTGDRSWLVAVAMVLSAMVAMALETVLLAAIRSDDHGTPWRVSLLDEGKAAVGLSTAMSTTGALVALAEPQLRGLAIPLFLTPLAMTQFAVRRQASIRSTYRQTVRSLSRLPELGGFTDQGHADRVSALSIAVGTELGLPERDLRDLEFAALLHDIGQVSLRVPIPGGATVLTDLDSQRRIARDGAEIVRHSGAPELVARIIEAQNTPYRQVREFGEHLPIASRIIKVVNAYDDLVGASTHPDPRAVAIERIQLGLGYEYDPRVVDALTEVIERIRSAPGGGSGARALR